MPSGVLPGGWGRSCGGGRAHSYRQSMHGAPVGCKDKAQAALVHIHHGHTAVMGGDEDKGGGAARL
eukprot:1157467-Pelagomonas_calceolata.AAC.7